MMFEHPGIKCTCGSPFIHSRTPDGDWRCGDGGRCRRQFNHPGITITRHEEDTFIRADGAALWAWATRPGAAWPCSSLAQSDGVEILLVRGDLVEISGDDEDLLAEELNAFIADATGRDHRDGF